MDGAGLGKVRVTICLDTFMKKLVDSQAEMSGRQLGEGVWP